MCPAAAVTGIATYAVLVVYFRRHIRDAPELEEEVHPSSLLVDRCEALTEHIYESSYAIRLVASLGGVHPSLLLVAQCDCSL